MTTTLKINYYGSSGSENFSIDFMGKNILLENIGTEPKVRSEIIKSKTPSDLIIKFGNSGTATMTKFNNKVEKVCRRTRRWGKRRRRCTDKVTPIPYNVELQRRVNIKSIEVNGFDITENIIKNNTSCDPTQGNVTKEEKIENGVLIKGGKYIISNEIIAPLVDHDMVKKSLFDAEIAKIPPLEGVIKNQNLTLEQLQQALATKSNDYEALLAKFNKQKTAKEKEERKNEVSTVKINTLNNEGKDLKAQLKWADNNIQSQSQSSASNYQKYMTAEGKYYQDIEKENIGLKNENKNRENANTTFKQKVFYKKETSKRLEIYNTIALYFYYFFVFAYLCISFYIDNKNGTVNDNIYKKIIFILIALIYPFIILHFTKYVLHIFNYIYSILNGITYEKIN